MYLENTKIIEIDNGLSNTEKRRNLKNLYDVINDIGKDLFNKGENISKYFLTKEKYEKIKQDSKKII